MYLLWKCPLQYDIRLNVEYMSFSAHADAKGIMQLIRDVDPANVMFVHGEDSKMNFLKSKVEKVCPLIYLVDS